MYTFEMLDPFHPFILLNPVPYVYFNHVSFPLVLLRTVRGRDSSVGKLSASQAGDLVLNPGGGLTQVTQCMNERRRDSQL